jgi:hypothetical protein
MIGSAESAGRVGISLATPPSTLRTLEDQFTLADVSVRNASDNVALSSGVTSTTPGRGQQASVMEHPITHILPVPERARTVGAPRISGTAGGPISGACALSVAEGPDTIAEPVA